MPDMRRRLIVIPCALLAWLMAGLPEFTALERAVSKVFVPAATVVAEPQSVNPPLPAGPGLIEWIAERPPVARRDLDARLLPTGPEDEGQARAEIPAASAGRREYGGVLTPLYVSFVALQGLDIHSTLMAMNRGARETNPMMAGLVNRPAAFVALKAGTAAGVLYMTERVRRHSPLGAVLMMVAFNSAYATVVANNYSVLSRMDR